MAAGLRRVCADLDELCRRGRRRRVTYTCTRKLTGTQKQHAYMIRMCRGNQKNNASVTGPDVDVTTVPGGGAAVDCLLWREVRMA